jgi:hypothetical protein
MKNNIKRGVKMKEYEIKTVKNEKDLKRVYYFLSKTFYEDAIEYNEHYYSMADRYKEMLDQLKKTMNYFCILKIIMK